MPNILDYRLIMFAGDIGDEPWYKIYENLRVVINREINPIKDEIEDKLAEIDNNLKRN